MDYIAVQIECDTGQVVAGTEIIHDFHEAMQVIESQAPEPFTMDWHVIRRQGKNVWQRKSQRYIYEIIYHDPTG